MPEGPEVETIKRGLAGSIVGQVFVDIRVVNPSTFAGNTEDLIAHAVGSAITGVLRRGKVLVITFANGWALMIHLKMTGQLVLVREGGDRLAGGHPTSSMANPLPDRSTRMIFEMTSGDRLYFNDQRKFGWVKLVKTSEVETDSLVSRMGPEVLWPQFRPAYLSEQLKRHGRAPVKAILLDQSVVAGVGNIYVDEALHLARIHPARLGGTLDRDEVTRLYESVRMIIEEGIEHGGTSFSHYVNSLGGKGDYLGVARVFKRTGQPCPVCGTSVIKIRVAGRGTHVCPHCQVLATLEPRDVV